MGTASSDKHARWSVHRAVAANDEELLDLFQKVFGQGMPLVQWQWKYADAPTRGMLLRRDNIAVAFFGGMPRTVLGPSGKLVSVQNGDVMVLPSERGVFSRHGALHHVAAAFFENMVGFSLPYDVAFGFPNGRHFKLGVKLGLYAPASRMITLTWSALESVAPYWTVTTELGLQDIHALESLWIEMRTSWSQHFIPVRDTARWKARFLSHPVHDYQLLLIRRRWTGQPLCAIALREHPEYIEWLDYVGPDHSTRLAVTTVRRFAGKSDKKPVTAMFSETIASSFNIDSASFNLSDIYIPINACTVDEGRPHIGQLWLMGGDTDFL